MTPPPPPPVAPGAEMDPYTPGTGAPVDIRPHGRGAGLPQYPKHRAEDPSTRRGGKQSKGGGKPAHTLQGKQ